MVPKTIATSFFFSTLTCTSNNSISSSSNVNSATTTSSSSNTTQNSSTVAVVVGESTAAPQTIFHSPPVGGGRAEKSCLPTANKKEGYATCHRSAGSVFSVQNGLPNITAGILTDTHCDKSVYYRLCSHHCRCGKTDSHYHRVVKPWLSVSSVQCRSVAASSTLSLQQL